MVLRWSRVAAAGAAIVIVVATGLGWGEASDVSGGFQHSSALSRSAPHSSGGAQNILLMGLDTRKDQNGDDLPASVLSQLHAGDGQEGGYNTNTLILVHIPADGKNIVAFSVPRDDFVTVDGLDVAKAKIKEAYGREKAQTEDTLSNEGVTDQHILETRGREAGRAETLQTVRELTGVPIDRFAEVSLVGFYDLAGALGGVQVCVNHAVHDDYSGADFSAGTHVLNAPQALAFVRQRHGLDNGDLDRTHRQQAFLVSVLHQLRSAGTFTDVGKLNRLVGVAQRDVVLSDGWDLVDWLQQMAAPTDQHIEFSTLPVQRYASIDGQDVNIVDPTAIRSRIHDAFAAADGADGAAPSAPAPSVAGTSAASARPSGPPDTVEPGSGPDNGRPVTNADGIPCVN